MKRNVRDCSLAQRSIGPAMGKSKRSSSVSRSDVSRPGSPTGNQIFPPWLSECTVIDIKNELLMSTTKQSSPSRLIAHLKSQNEDIVQTWRHFTRSYRFDPTNFNDRRLENSCWRYWFKQRLECSMGNTEPPPTVRRDFPMGNVKLSPTVGYDFLHAGLRSQSDPCLLLKSCDTI